MKFSLKLSSNLKYGLFSILIGLFFLTLTKAVANQQQTIEKKHWQWGVAIGAGIKTNPLVDGNNIPLFLLPDIAWYGERMYFDNLELGYQWYDSQKLSIQSYINVDKESAYFKYEHPANLLLLLESSMNGPSDTDKTLSIKSLGKRKWAFHAGFRASWHAGQHYWSISAEQDISGAHNGQKLIAGYAYQWHFNKTRVSLKPQIMWFSRQFTHYYYGIDHRDTDKEAFHYNAKAGWQPSVHLQLARRINADWTWLTYLQYQHLHKGMKNSPVVDKNNVTSVFSGFAYQF